MARNGVRADSLWLRNGTQNWIRKRFQSEKLHLLAGKRSCLILDRSSIYQRTLNKPSGKEGKIECFEWRQDPEGTCDLHREAENVKLHAPQIMQTFCILQKLIKLLGSDVVGHWTKRMNTYLICELFFFQVCLANILQSNIFRIKMV